MPSLIGTIHGWTTNTLQGGGGKLQLMLYTNDTQKREVSQYGTLQTAHHIQSSTLHYKKAGEGYVCYVIHF